MEDNEFDSGHTELEVFVGYPNGDVSGTLGNEGLELIRAKNT